jgi:hypothetical protein
MPGRQFVVKTTILLFGFVLAAAIRPVGSQEQLVWSWFASCDSKELILDVSLDGVLLYNSAIQICRVHRGAPEGRGARKRIAFSFHPRRAITWSGYQNADVNTAAGQTLKMDLWEAGADPDELLLGVSVSDKHTIYMNTIHPASPDKPKSTEIARGLVVSTRPATDSTS